MRTFLTSVLITAVLAAPVFSNAGVETRAGSLMIGGKIKWLYAYRGEDDSTVDAAGNRVENFHGFDGSPREDLLTTSVELDLNGSLGDNVSYTIELMASGPPSASNPVAGLQTGQANPHELGSMGVRQAFAVIEGILPMTEITVGTFNLPAGIYQQRATSDYDLIMLPLLNTEVFGDDGAFGTPEYTPIGLGWQVTGASLALRPLDWIELDFTYFNGGDNDGANQEADLEKSTLLNLKLLRGNGSMISVAWLSEGWDEPGLGEQAATGYVVSGLLLTRRLEMNFDWMQMTAEDYTWDDGVSMDSEDLTWTGYQVTLGWWMNDNIEALLRYEFIDPNTQNDGDAWPSSEYDDLTVWTVGLNYRLSEGVEASLNYLFIVEPGEDIEAQATTPEIPSTNPKYQGVDNDTLLVQVQVWQ